MDDISNDYLKQQAPMSDEQYADYITRLEAGEFDEDTSPPLALPNEDVVTDEVVVTEKRIPDDGSLDDQGNPIEQPEGVLGYAKDMASGIPIGVANAGTEIIHGFASLGDVVNNIAGGDPEYFTKLADEYASRMTDEDYKSIGLSVPVSVAGKFTQGTAQFLTGFIPALKAVRMIGGGISATTKLGAAAKTMAGAGTAGAIADYSVFNPYEERISNWAKDSGVPGLDNAVTQYLAASADDSEAEGRLKQVIEGSILGKVAGATFDTLKLFKKTKQVALEEQGLTPPSQTKMAYVTDPATGTKVELDTTLGPAYSSADGSAINIPRFTADTERVAVRVPDEQTQMELASLYMNGDLEGAARIESGLVNLKYLDTEADIKDMIEAMALTREAVGAGKSKRTWEEAAAKEGADLKTYTAKVAGLDSDVAKAERARLAVAYKVQELAKISFENPSKMTLEEFKDAWKKLNVVDAMVSQNKSEIARALAIMRRRTGSDFVDSVTSAAKGAVGLDGRTNWEKLASMVADLPDGTQINQMVKASKKPNFWDAATEVYVNGLFSPVTLTTNLMSTGLSIGNSVAERYLGAARSQLTGSGELTIREANQYALGLVKAVPEAVRVMGKAWKTQQPQTGVDVNEFVDDLTTKHHGFTKEAFGIVDPDTPLMQQLGKGIDLMGTAIRSLPGGTRSLLATDEFLKTIVYRGELAALAQRQAVKEGIEPGSPEFATMLAQLDSAVANKKVGDPYYGINLAAMDSAARATFTEKLGEGGQSLLEGLRHFKTLSYIPLPFVKTPTNLLKYIGRRTPGLAGFSDYMQSELVAGGARADLAVAQIGMGTMYATAGLALAGAGVLQGDITSNWAVARNLRALGIQQGSVVLPNGSQEQIGRFDGSPISFLMLSAAVHETIEAYVDHNKERLSDAELGDEVLKMQMLVISAGMKYALNKSWAQGLSSLINAAQEGNWETYVATTASNFVPAGNTMRWANVQGDIDPFAREIDDTLDAIRAKLPQFSKDVPPKANLLGDPSRMPQYRAMGLLPTYNITPPDHPVYQELSRLQRVTPDEVVLGGVPKTLGDVALDGVEQWNYMQFLRYTKADGKDLIEALGEAIADPEYQAAPDGMKEKILSDIYAKRRKLAQQAMEWDAAMFYAGKERPYAENFRLYDYKRKNSITDKISIEQALKNKKMSGQYGEEGQSKESFIQERKDAITNETDFIQLLTQ